MRQPDDPPSYNEVYIAYASAFLNDMIRIKNGNESIATQGQALDGYSQLANYNGLAEQVEQFLELAENEFHLPL